MSEEITYGVTSDFDWYELTQIKSQLELLSARINRVIHVIKEREQTQAEYVVYLKQQCDQLRAQLNALRKD